MASKKKKRNPANPDAINSDLINLQLERKNSQQALDSAKYYHKQNRSLQSEELLAAAYQLRIRQLKASNLVKEAVQLIAVAKEKCPHFTDLFDITEFETFQFPLAMQDVQRLIGLMQSHTTSQKKTESLQESLKKGLSDPRHLLQCEELAADHPLKQEAAIVMDAFEAAADECPQLEREQRLQCLAQVPRRSILADWCYLVRALDAFHRFDDQQAQLYVDRISKDSAASRAAIFLQVQLEGKLIPKGLSSKPARLLWNSMTEDSLRTHWLKICRLIQTRQTHSLCNAALQFFHSPYFTSPLLLRLALQSFIDEMFREEYCDKKIARLLQDEFQRVWGDDGVMLYKLCCCCGMEKEEQPGEIAQAFEESEQEWRNRLPKQERALILARSALWYEKENEQKKSYFFPFSTRKKCIGHTDSIRLYKEANRLSPQVEYFQKLVELQYASNAARKDIESTLMDWKTLFPKDAAPLIYLFEEAEGRNALNKALTYLEQAEQIDHLNPKVRDARHRLVWKNILKHLKQDKRHLVKKDLEKVDYANMKPFKQALFQGVEKLLLFMESNYNTLKSESFSTFQILLFHHLNYAAEMKNEKALNQVIPLPELRDESQIGCYFDLYDALFSIKDAPLLPQKWHQNFPTWILKSPILKEDLLLRICRTIESYHNPLVVFAATSRGLKDNGPNLHKFMYYRSLLLIMNHWDSDEIQMECYFAALHLSNIIHDFEFANLCKTAIEKSLHDTLDLLGVNTENINLDELIVLTEKELEQILRREKRRKDPSKPSFRSRIFSSKRSPIFERIIDNIPVSTSVVEEIFNDIFDEDDFDDDDGFEDDIFDENDFDMDGFMEDILANDNFSISNQIEETSKKIKTKRKGKQKKKENHEDETPQNKKDLQQTFW